MAFRVTAVRPDTPAAAAGVVSGDLLLEVENVPTSEAVAADWRDLGVDAPPDGAGYAARVLAAGSAKSNDDPQRGRRGSHGELAQPLCCAAK
ncbi:PDZ domain-containing protein [Brevundimonas bullata]